MYGCIEHLHSLSVFAPVFIMQTKKIFTTPRYLALLVLGLLVLLSHTAVIKAQTVTEGYGTDETLKRGMLVAVKLNDPKKVEALTGDSLDRLKGVVVQPNDSPVTLSSEDHKVFVATSGNYEVLVNDQNGPIKEGDYISISPLAGVGMKANDVQSVVLGRAVTAFNAQTDSIGSTILDQGDKSTVRFGRIQVAVAINRNPLLKVPEQNKLPKFLARLGESIANKPVSTSRIYLAVTIFVVSALIAGVLLYSGTKNGLISIGRNPLSKKTILRGLLQVVILSLIIFITGIFGVYLLLKL
jgi:hypothetical protein